MRWLPSLSLALVTGVFSNPTWTQGKGMPFARWSQEAEACGSAVRTDMRGTPSPFVEQSDGVLVVQHDRGWSYSEAKFLPDMDGDGYAEVALAAHRPSMCGNDLQGDLEIHSGRFLTPISKWEAFAAFSTELGTRSGVLEYRRHGWKGAEIRVGCDLRGRERWVAILPWFAVAHYAGDLDGDAYEDVVIAGTWTDSPGMSVDSVRVLAGMDGHVLWATGEDQPHYPMDMTAAGDWNQDDIPDVAVIYGQTPDQSIAILSGTDGSSLVNPEFPASDLSGLSGAGDLDADGLIDFRCRIGSWAVNRWVFYSSSTWLPLDVADGWNVVWSANRGDLDGDHRDDLVIGRVHPTTYERRISIYSSATLTDVRLVGLFEPPWDDEVGSPDVGRFHRSQPWHVLLPLRVKDGRYSGPLTVIYPGI